MNINYMDGPDGETLKWVVVFLLSTLSIAVVVGLFWLIFYSNAFANNSVVMPLRKTYDQTYSKVTNKETSAYTIQPQEKTPTGNYTYIFTGTFVRLNTKNKTMALKGLDEKMYYFGIDNAMMKDENTWLKIYKVPNIKKLTNAVEPTDANITSDMERVLTKHILVLLDFDTPSEEIGTIMVRWEDKRTLTEINSDYTKLPVNPLNNTSLEKTVLAQLE